MAAALLHEYKDISEQSERVSSNELVPHLGRA